MDENKLPTLDFDAVAAMDETARAEALDAYHAAVETYAASLESSRKSGETLENELKSARYEAAKYRLANDKSCAGFAGRMEQIEQILAERPALAALPDEEKLRTAYYIDRGMQAVAEPDAETLFTKLTQNPEALRLVEAKILEKLGEGCPPALFASAGSASMPATVKEKPKSIDEASALARAAFGL